MYSGLLKEIAAHGDRGAVVPISRFGELKYEMEALKRISITGLATGWQVQWLFRMILASNHVLDRSDCTQPKSYDWVYLSWQIDYLWYHRNTWIMVIKIMKYCSI